MSARKIEQDPPHIAAARARLMDEVCAALPPEAVYRQSPPMTDTPGALEERLRRNAGWRNERHQCVTDPNLLTEAADEIASLRARVEAREQTTIDVAAHLAAAISLLEKGGKAAKKAAPSDKMFDQMIRDYKASLNRARQALRDTPVE